MALIEQVYADFAQSLAVKKSKSSIPTDYYLFTAITELFQNCCTELETRKLQTGEDYLSSISTTLATVKVLAPRYAAICRNGKEKRAVSIAVLQSCHIVCSALSFDAVIESMDSAISEEIKSMEGEWRAAFNWLQSEVVPNLANTEDNFTQKVVALFLLNICDLYNATDSKNKATVESAIRDLVGSVFSIVGFEDEEPFGDLFNSKYSTLVIPLRRLQQSLLKQCPTDVGHTTDPFHQQLATVLV